MCITYYEITWLGDISVEEAGANVFSEVSGKE